MACVLVVEDHPANLKLARLLLEKAGHTVLSSDNGLDGITVARESRPDLILMDIQLPGMDGLEATRILKADPETRAIPVVALTAFAMRADADKMRLAGCDYYLAKPYRNAELFRIVEQALQTA